MAAQTEPLVSVLCATYQHADFIEQCVRSLCTQDTDFEYEVIVRDDASTDGTSEILRRLQNEFPDRLRLILETLNRFPEISPMDAILTHAHGDFVAFCEGDDFWTSSDKLQKCVNELAKNPSLSLVGHLTEVFEAHLKEDAFPAPALIGMPGRFARGEIPNCHTSSIVMRREFLLPMVQAIPSVPYGDIRLKMIAAESGPSLVLEDVLSRYWVHENGIWSGTDRLTQLALVRETWMRLLPYSHFCRQRIEFLTTSGARMLLFGYLRELRFGAAIGVVVDTARRNRSPKAMARLLRPPSLTRLAKVASNLVSSLRIAR